MSWCRSWLRCRRWCRFLSWCRSWLRCWCTCRFLSWCRSWLRCRRWCRFLSWCRSWLRCRRWCRFLSWCRSWLRCWCRFWCRFRSWCCIRFRLWYRLWLRCYFWFWLWYRLWFRHYFWFWLWYRLWLRYYFWFWLWYRLWFRNHFWFWYRLWLRCYFWFRLWHWLWFRNHFWFRLWCRVWEGLRLRSRLWIIHLLEVIVYISWWFNRSWNWVVVWEWWITLQIRVYFPVWSCRIICYRSFCLDFWNFTSNDIVTVVTSTRRCQWCAWSTFEWTWISVQSSVHLFISICLSRRRPTSNNEWFASRSFVDFKIVITIFTVYFCNFSLIRLPLFTSLINFTCIDECVLRYIFSTNIWCSKIVHLRWIKGVEFRYSWTFRINDFRNTFHIVVVCATLKFDQFLTDNTLTKDTWCFLSWVSCSSYMLVTRDITVVWSCKLLTSKAFLRIACQICFISSRFVKLTWSRVTLDKLIVSCLLSNCIRNRSLNVWLVFIFVTWVVGITNLKCFILKVSVDQWEGYVTWITSVSTSVSQGIGYIRVVVSDVAWKRDIAFSSFEGTCISFSTIRFLHNTQMYIWVSWKATSDGWTVYWKSSVVIKISLIARSMICLKELPYTKGITICVWI